MQHHHAGAVRRGTLEIAKPALMLTFLYSTRRSGHDEGLVVSKARLLNQAEFVRVQNPSKELLMFRQYERPN
jgi:hypothetical protein